MIPSILNEALGFNIHRVAVFFRRGLVQALKEYSMTPEQWQVMAALWWSEDQLNQVQLGALTLKDKPTLSRMITRMESKGWIQRQADASDGRSYYIRLTPKGQRLKSQVPKTLNQYFTPILETLPLRERQSLVGSLQKLRVHFKDQ